MRWLLFIYESDKRNSASITTRGSIATRERERMDGGGIGEEGVAYLAPLSPRPWSQTMVALCAPLGLTTCVRPYSSLFPPASNHPIPPPFHDSIPNPPKRIRIKIRTQIRSQHQSHPIPSHFTIQSRSMERNVPPEATELVPPKLLIPRTIAAAAAAAPPRPLAATLAPPPNSANKKKNTTVTTQTPPPPPDKGEASARAYEGGEVEVAVATRRDATRYKGKGGFGRRKGEQLFLVLSRGSAWSRESTRDRRRSEQEEEEGTTTTTTALRCAT